MTAERWSLVRETFGATIGLDSAARAAALAALHDADLRAEVESLLAAHGDAGDFLEDDPSAILEGTLLGPYRVASKIGEGGMGTVYLGYRSGEGFEQKVALKVIPALRASAELDRRFVAERGILAGIEHPNIVRMLGGGEFEGGRYIAMEYVAGAPITKHCADLPIEERLRLFRTLCSAIHHAHRHLIVHRDIKSSNVLVTAQGEVKVLDFGIAKLLAPDRNQTAVTRSQPMSLDCASPEQVKGQAITTATDVYALGVLLYEVLTGVSSQGGPGRSLDEAVKRICDITPEPPSAHSAAIPRDLDSIVLRAMRKEPSARYASAEDLSADIGRYLAGAPVIAQEATLRYVARKFVGRHRLAVGSAIAAGLLLAVTASVAVWQARVASKARFVAEQRAVETRKLARSVIFDMQLQLANIPGTLAVRQKMIAQTVSFLESLAREAANDAALEIEIAGSYLRIGDIQGGSGVSNLGDPQGALKSWRFALHLAEGVFAREPANLEAIRVASIVHGRLGGSDAIPNRSERANHREQAVLLARKVREARPNNDLADDLLGSALFARAFGAEDPAARIAVYQEALGVYQPILNRDPASSNKMRNVALCAKYLANEYQHLKQFQKAWEYAAQARGLDEARLGKAPEDRSVLVDLTNDLGTIGFLSSQLNRHSEAVNMLRWNLDLRTKLAASDPGDAMLRERLAKSRQSYAWALVQNGDLREARTQYEGAIAIHTSLLDAAPRNLAELAADNYGVGVVAEKEGKRKESCRQFRLSRTLIDRERTEAGSREPDPPYWTDLIGKLNGCAGGTPPPGS